MESQKKFYIFIIELLKNPFYTQVIFIYPHLIQFLNYEY